MQDCVSGSPTTMVSVDPWESEARSDVRSFPCGFDRAECLGGDAPGILRALDEIKSTDREVHAPMWTSRRHLEAVYRIEGSGETQSLPDGPCISLPPIAGTEVRAADGAYPPAPDEGPSR